MGGNNVNAKSSQKVSGFECNVQGAVSWMSTIHDIGKNHRHFAGPVAFENGSLFLFTFGAVGFKYICPHIGIMQ